MLERSGKTSVGQGMDYQPVEHWSPAHAASSGAFPFSRRGGTGPRGQPGRKAKAEGSAKTLKEWARDKKALPEEWRGDKF